MSDLTEAEIHDWFDGTIDFLGLRSLFERISSSSKPLRGELTDIAFERVCLAWKCGRLSLSWLPFLLRVRFAARGVWAWFWRRFRGRIGKLRFLALDWPKKRSVRLTDTPSVDAGHNLVSVVIPVYNGLGSLQRLCATLFEHTGAENEIVFVNDASPDERIAPYLDMLAKSRANVRVLTNADNLGFPGSVNRGAESVSGDFVILNTDTEVPEGWIPRLFAPIWSDPRVASAMPLTCVWRDSGKQNPGVISISELERIGLAAVDAAVSHIVPLADRNESKGNLGFCLAISREAWNRVGPFAATIFGFGYHEESDWCARARYRFGYSHRVAPNVLVAHWHNGSFTSERKRVQMAHNRERLYSRNPCRAFDHDPVYGCSRKWIHSAVEAAFAGYLPRRSSNG